ncbi:helix-turn-helix domain-containing protein [Streptomyces hoynatensis]|uniref:XRE family transcriptional regulator n=1 Tax=Streptomyces hoynatensis TaxID=1141874 RepID=A0A3A9YFD1_9ACTN|nr:helix-turn-helix transcriptional regulator [Streptomyces hoynatensis]RKN35861.1 XRE family transcriptional regulator [Streptomyces hoynatensis]
MDASPGSTVPRRQLGRHLRELRMRARLTLKAASREMEWSDAKMWRIESGLTSVRTHDVRAMCETYGAAPDLTEALLGLAKETKARGWWHAFGDVIPEHFDVYIGLEAAAARLDWYEPELVPGLLQTEDYARIIIGGGFDDPDEVERRVVMRRERQRLITRPKAAASVRGVLGEAVLRRPIGGFKLMGKQLTHLVEMAQLPNVNLRVLPFSAGAHLGLQTGQFIVMRFPTAGSGAETEPPTVHADGYTGDLYLDRPSEVERYDKVFDDIWKKALDEQATQQLISDLAGSYEEQQ